MQNFRGKDKGPLTGARFFELGVSSDNLLQEMPKLQPFTWAPLRRSTSIRVISVENCPQNALARCSMSEVDLDDNPAPFYRALSYSWERDQYLWLRTTPRPRKYTIICNGQSLAVGENLYFAIRYFASQPDRAPIWIDAICIHQGTAEVGSQIQMMGRIYQSARDVVVWLGKPNSFSTRGMRWIADNYGKQSNENLSDMSTNPETLFRVDMDEFLQAFSSNNAEKPSMKQILHIAAGEAMVEYIFTLRWFMRV